MLCVEKSSTQRLCCLSAEFSEIKNSTPNQRSSLSMIRVISAMLLLGVASAQAQTIPTCPVAKGICGISVPINVPALVTSQLTSGYRIYQRIINAGATGSGTAWCTRPQPNTNANPAVNSGGSYAIAPYGNSLGEPSVEEFGSGQAGATSSSQGSTFVPQTPTICVSDGGSSGTAAASLTVEVQ